MIGVVRTLEKEVQQGEAKVIEAKNATEKEAAQKKQAISTDQLYTLGVLEHNKANYDAAITYFLQSLENHPNAVSVPTRT